MEDLAFAAELSFVFVSSYLLFYLQTNYLAPKLALLFDSQGYMFTTQALFAACCPPQIQNILHYIAGACHDEAGRQAILAQTPGLAELVKSGPVLPFILLACYGISHTPVLLSNWNLGAGAMLTLSSLTVCGIWGFARALADAKTGRIAYILAITYGGFSANAGRILTEIPATALALFALLFVFLFVQRHEKAALSTALWAGRPRVAGAGFADTEDLKSGGTKPDADLRSDGAKVNADLQSVGDATKANLHSKGSAITALLQSAGCGCLTGLLMLARPTLLPWPILLGFALALYSYMHYKAGRVTGLLNWKTVLAFFLGCVVALSPWMLSKQILTGKPSITVERYGPLNLSRGMDLRTDGYDSLPSPWVTHPESFGESMAQVVSHVAKQFGERPAAFIHLLLRKPARLIDSPWNDFQTRVLGIPFLVQRIEHQFVLLAAALGVVMLLEHGRKRPDYLLLFAGLLIGLFVSFHFVACLFITMARYFVTAMPVAIVAAAYFLSNLLKKDRKSFMAFAAVLATPVLSFCLYYVLLPGYGRLSDYSSDFGLAPVALCAALLMTAVFANSLLLPAFTIFRGARSKLVLCSFALFAGLFCFVTVSYQFMCSEAVMRLGVVDHGKLVATINIPPGTNYTNWYLVMDANDASEHGIPEPAEGILSDIQLRFNGRELKTDWLPLLTRDNSMREEQLFMAAFAYSANKRCRDFRQWRCTVLPAENMLCPGENKLEFSLRPGEKTHPKIFADFADPMGKRIHTVSLREFSWTKGFFAGVPGEMRLDEWTENSDKNYDAFSLSGQASKLKPRIYLLGVNAANPSENWLRTVKLPDQQIGSGRDKMMAAIDVPPLFSDTDFGPEMSLRIRVSGQVKGAEKDSQVSVCMIENFDKNKSSYQEYAPLAPETIYAPSDKWRDFAFEDIVNPLRIDHTLSAAEAQANTARLKSLKVQFFQTPWWEALGYGVFKGPAKTDFRNLKVEVFAQPGMNLAFDNRQWFELESQFEP